ncbi:MAG: polyamine aminopropyltransferase [Planctomycetota bacterium]
MDSDTTPDVTGASNGRSDVRLLLLASIFLLAVCALVYELIAGTLESYLLGDATTQWSLVIGLFLTAMGVGSWLSRFVRRELLGWFITIELAAGLIGGAMALAGFATFAYTELHGPVLWGMLCAVGILVGMEIPLVVRILRSFDDLRATLANVLPADYLGSLVASLIFPFVLLPYLGLVQACAVVGLVNVAVAMLLLWRLGPLVAAGRRRALWVAATIGVAMLLVTAFTGTRLVRHMENSLYQDEVIFATTTSFQRLVLTRWRGDTRLYLDGHLQFSSVDEYRYHECLVMVPLALAPRHERVLILGGGDGMAAREVLRHPAVRQVDLVDLDPAVTRLFTSNPQLMELNDASLLDERVRVHNADAMQWLEDHVTLYDLILMDLPDPSTPALAKLYSREFFDLVGRHLAPDGVLATQATSPFRSRAAFWCIASTIAAARVGPRVDDPGVAPAPQFQVRPYHATVPTFGTWGWIVAGADLPDPAQVTLPWTGRFLTPELLPRLFAFPADMARVQTPVSHLDDPAVHRLYRQGYHTYLE